VYLTTLEQMWKEEGRTREVGPVAIGWVPVVVALVEAAAEY
jgi:hypothetical protein